MTKKITFILGSLGKGGAERVVSIIANHYAEKSWDVDIILLLNSECEYELNSKINVISLVTNSVKDDIITRIKQVPKWVLGIRKYIHQNNPNVILSFAARINIITAIANYGMKNKLIISERNDPFKDGRSGLVKKLTEIIYPRVDKVVLQTKRAQSYFSKKVEDNSVIIYNPVTDLTSFKRTEKFKKRIISVGRLELQKNHSLLIDAFMKVHSNYPEYELFIFGEGTLRENLEKKIKRLNLTESVYLPGVTDDIHNEMISSEIFVLSSDYEGMSNALLEAMTLGIPVISTKCAGSTEIIEDGENGILVSIGDVDQIARAVRHLIENKDNAIKMGLEAQKTSALFATKNIIKDWEEVLEGD